MARGKKANGHDAAAETPAEAKSNHKPEDEAECYLATKELKRKIAQLSQTLSATYGRYENMGVDVESVKDCHKLEKHDDPSGKLKRLLRMAQILDLVPTEVEKNGQASIMPNLVPEKLNETTKEKVSLARAYSDGYNTGLHDGSENNNRFAPGSELRVKWSLGHIDGQAQRAINKPENKNVIKAPTEVRKRAGRAADKAPETALEKDEAKFRGNGTDAQPAAE